jgi:hypothetical protein
VVSVRIWPGSLRKVRGHWLAKENSGRFFFLVALNKSANFEMWMWEESRDGAKRWRKRGKESKRDFAPLLVLTFISQSGSTAEAKVDGAGLENLREKGDARALGLVVRQEYESDIHMTEIDWGRRRRECGNVVMWYLLW